MRVDRLHRTGGEHRAQREGHVRRVPHFRRRGGHQARQTLAAILRIAAERAPSVIDELTISGGVTLGRDDTVPVQRCTMLIARLVERGENFAREFRRLVQYGLSEVRGHFLVARQGDHVVQAGEFVDHELHILYRRAVFGHGTSPGNSGFISRAVRGGSSCRACPRWSSATHPRRRSAPAPRSLRSDRGRRIRGDAS